MKKKFGLPKQFDKKLTLSMTHKMWDKIDILFKKSGFENRTDFMREVIKIGLGRYQALWKEIDSVREK